MSYNSTTGIITAPVSIADVKQALGASSNDLGTLCTSSNINKWSLKKPHFTNDLTTKKIVHIDYDNDKVYYTDGTTGMLAEYLQYPNNDSYVYSFGMRMISYTNVKYNLNIQDTILSGVINNTRYYEAYQSELGSYMYPVNNANYHEYLHGYRLTDFNGYNHKAKENALLGCRFEVHGTWQPTPTATETLTIGDISLYTGNEVPIETIKNVDDNLKNGKWTGTNAIYQAPKAILNNSSGYIKIRLETMAQKDSEKFYSLDYILNKMFSWSPSGNNLTQIYLAVEIRNTSSDPWRTYLTSIYSYASSDIYPKPLRGAFINNEKTANRTYTAGNTEYKLWEGNSVQYCIPIGKYNATEQKFKFDNRSAGISSSFLSFVGSVDEVKYIDVKFYNNTNSSAPFKFPPFSTDGVNESEYFEIAINIGFCVPTDGIATIVDNTTFFPSYGLRKVIKFIP